MTALRIICVCSLICTGCGSSNPIGNENENDNRNDNDNGNINAPLCGNGVLDDGELCDDGNVSNTDGCLSACADTADCCVPNECGDGHVDETPVGAGWQVEACDDGNTVGGDLCRGDCGQDLTVCGDGLLNQGEECDLGGQNADTPNAECRRSCQSAGCGDGIHDDQSGEECDDGADNHDSQPNACRTDCTAPACGDGVLDDLSGESCDDATANSDSQPDACRTHCALAGCGDAVVDTGEQCDDSDLNGATCGGLGYDFGTLSCHVNCSFNEANCRFAVCGNGTVEGAEDCDLFELNGQDCVGLGFYGGSLSCSQSCAFNTSGCFGPPTIPVGAPCQTQQDCTGGSCLPEAGPYHWGPPGGYCYEYCDINGQCPGSAPNSLCVQIGSTAYCMAECDPANPGCRAGYDCIASGSDAFCMWSYCTQDSQCTVTGDCDTDSTSSTFGWCVSPQETCDNAVDDDFDSLSDCADPECNGVPSCPLGEICGNAVDDDADGATDCADGECVNLGLCTGELCSPPAGVSLGCGDVLTGEANDQAGSTDVIDSAECVDPNTGLAGSQFTNQFGPEYAYRLTVTQARQVTITVDNFTGDLDVYLIKEILGACDAHRGCFDWGGEGVGVPEVITFTAYPGLTYYVVVDGYGGTISTYDLAVTCASTGYEDCSNAVDDDGDYLSDCADPECWGTGGCTTETDCANGYDEDLDGAVDCSDADCVGAPGC